MPKPVSLFVLDQLLIRLALTKTRKLVYETFLHTPKASISCGRSSVSWLQASDIWSISVLLFNFSLFWPPVSVREKQPRNWSERTWILTPSLGFLRSDVIFYSVDIGTHVESLVMFFSFIKNNGTDRNTLTLDIVNFRQVIFNDERFVTVSREVRFLNSVY